jgi:hypothetical protein
MYSKHSGPLGPGQWMRAFDEMNELGQQHEQIIQDGVPNVHVL